HFQITAKGDLRRFASTFAWIQLSHFGVLATVSGCEDLELLARIRGELQDFGLKFIPYEYVAGQTYRGKCNARVGFSCANRHFELAVRFNGEDTSDTLCPPSG